MYGHTLQTLVVVLGYYIVRKCTGIGPTLYGLMSAPISLFRTVPGPYLHGAPIYQRRTGTYVSFYFRALYMSNRCISKTVSACVQFILCIIVYISLEFGFSAPWFCADEISTRCGRNTALIAPLRLLHIVGDSVLCV